MSADEPVEKVSSFGSTGRRIRQKYTLNPGYDPSAECFCVRFSPDDEYLACCFANGLIHVYSSGTGRQEFVLKEKSDKKENPNSLMNQPLPTTQLRWRPENAGSKTKGVLISANAEFDGQIRHWHIRSGKCLHTITEKANPIFALDYVVDGTQFATAGRDRLVRIYDEETKRLAQTLSGGDIKEAAGGGTGHSNRVFSLKYHPSDPNILLSGGWDKTVQVWDTRKGHAIRSLWNCYLCGDSVDFSQDGSEIVAGSWRKEKALQIFNFASGEVIETVDWASPASKGSMLLSAQFSKDPTSTMILAGGSQANEAMFFTRQSGQCVPFGALTNAAKPVYTVDWTPSGRLAAIGGGDGHIRVIEVA